MADKSKSDKTPADPERPELRNVIEAATKRVQAVIAAAEESAAQIISDAQAEGRRHVEEARERADRLTLERTALMARTSDELLENAGTFRAYADALIGALEVATAEMTGQRADAGAEPRSVEPEPQVSEPAPPAPERAAGVERPEPAAPLAEPQATVPTPTPGEASTEPADPLEASRSRISKLGIPRRVKAEEVEAEKPAPVKRVEATAEKRVPRRRGRKALEGARLLATQMAVSGSSWEEIESRLRDEFGVEDPASILEGVPGIGPK